MGTWISVEMVIYGVANWIKYLSTAKEESEKKEELRAKYSFWIRLGIILWFALVIPATLLNLTQSFKPVIYLYPEEETEVSV